MQARQALADIQHLLTNVLQAPAQWQALAPFADTDAELAAQVLDEAAKFVDSAIAPLQRSGDEEGCRFDAGQVHTPAGFRDAYQAFWQAGWPLLSCAPDDGGQGLPAVLECVLFEWLAGANHGWTMAPGLLHGAYECIKHHASDELKAQYLPKIATGEWLATMCLTEAHAGSDLGLVRTRGVPQPDGSARVNGSKIFISGGEHDLTDNIVHLVLARLPDAPAGPKGLSLFLVPKVLPDGSRNAVVCERIEEKMGLHGSPTCVMRFDDATGWLVGEPNKGLNAMFVMMNAARLHVGLQGIGLLEAAWQKASAYAAERRQMRAPGATDTSLIQDHPAIRRTLQTQRAWIDGGRVLAYHTALQLDIAKHSANAGERAAAQRWCALVTPVLKAALTTEGFHGASACLQVFGGHGYVREWGIEQIVRDARVAMIYEGTNEIQAIDLLVRKVLADGGQGLAALLASLPGKAPGAAARARRHTLVEITQTLAIAAQTDPELPYWVADDYLRAVALVLLEWAWGQISAANPRDPASAPTSAFERWDQPAKAFAQWVLPEFDLRTTIVRQRIVQALEIKPKQPLALDGKALIAI
ncbi:MAG: acyl-CoA dehydrogenase family protein [Gammaproteobacteria bacterium]|nr:acyl-CoA dehydrogenase family protein [Gammaproteobacteria bacterium]MBU1507657.1 acyl-CoA dehydrogenase family protein [Gammaproteobacteria bacterium]MBU2118879.1 acyl-CoA dehydrogenase family protein [Gammaproteobacteria bacterium]MBU2172347.1 acyl-CoA dehydrogenase family protein [Gammaproteobacteria bacterium]MBU2200043.1 acyl-CoA dehydrogenase family protein [Gammaproteobacteria bacterium]